jgi:hypothetical protein
MGMSTIDGTAIDQVLQAAVDTGAVPHVAAIAADADGIVYEGGAGPRIAGEALRATRAAGSSTARRRGCGRRRAQRP